MKDAKLYPPTPPPYFELNMYQYQSYRLFTPPRGSRSNSTAPYVCTKC